MANYRGNNSCCCVVVLLCRPSFPSSMILNAAAKQMTSVSVRRSGADIECTNMMYSKASVLEDDRGLRFIILA